MLDDVEDADDCSEEEEGKERVVGVGGEGASIFCCKDHILRVVPKRNHRFQGFGATLVQSGGNGDAVNLRAPSNVAVIVVSIEDAGA